MPYAPVDIKNIQLDTPQLAPDQPSGFIPVDISQIKLDQPSAQRTTAGRTAFDQGMQGATFGFADEASDALGAFGAKVYSKAFNPELTSGKTVGDLYNEARALSKNRLQSEMQERPVESTVANLGGALLTGGAGTTTKIGSGIANSLRTGNTAARIAKGAVAGAASGGLYGAGAADDGNRLQGAEQGAVTGAFLGGAIPATGAAASALKNGGQTAIKGALARSPEALQNTASSLKNAAGGLYNQMRAVGAVLNPNATQGLIADIDNSVAKQKFIAALNPKTIAIIDDMKEAAKSGQLGLDEIDQYRRLLSRVGGSEDGVSAGAAKKTIDNFVSNLNSQHLVNGGQDAVRLLHQGRAQYAQASKFEDVADILTKADGDPNKIKSGLTRFLNNADNIKGYTTQEITALKNAARSSAPEKLLKMFGKFGIDLGTSLTPGNTIGPIIGGAVTGNPLVPVAGTMAKQGQKYLARGKAENLLQIIQNRQISNQSAIPKRNPFITQMATPTMGVSAAQKLRAHP